MVRLPLEQITPGLRLGTPVYNVNGVLLLRSGEVLTARHLQVFKGCGIQALDVADEESEARAPDTLVPPELAAAVEKKIAHRFRRTDPGDPVIAALRQFATRRLTTEVLGAAARQRATRQ